MKILESNFIIPMHCRVESEEGTICDKLFFIDNLNQNVFDLNIDLGKVKDNEILSMFLTNNDNLNIKQEEIFVQDLVNQQIPNMEDILNMIKKHKESTKTEED